MPAVSAIAPTSFADLLRGHRRAAALTQEELAGRARIGVRTLRELERGRSTPQRATAELLATALGLVGKDRDGFLRTARAGRPVATRPPATPTIANEPDRDDLSDAVAALMNLVEKVDDPAHRAQLMAQLTRVWRQDGSRPGAERLEPVGVRAKPPG